ncbi:unnamed protein product [Ambrosiozyma monospora]|uniref:Unnamed protein product n=1 Tax=Ambrosiozyma monospora TaxID=43982 RepID=A0ACB5UCF9_AMBMO|nr:unnamed protein product [Ambrosiozyma monospora]
MSVLSSVWEGTRDFFLVLVLGIDKKATTVTEDDLSDYTEDQDSDGAPVEKKSPLGYEVTYFSAFYLVLQGVIGTGVCLIFLFSSIFH